MTERTDFFSQAFYTITRAIAEAGVNVDLFKTPETIAVSVNRRVRAELKRLAVLLRRLIFLAALQMELAPMMPRIGSNYYEPKQEEADYRYIFTMVPAPSRPCPPFMKGPVTVPGRGPVPAAPLIARWQTMLDTLKHHKRRAKCLARTIQRWQAAGEARPHVPPIPRRHRMPAALGVVSGGLTVQLIDALKTWPAADTS
ncbi:hypothetical protein HAD_08280 [Hyphomonas adhaerens MHS-3]|uniref:Uncharacterized protein n=1 Tax=Hyphomonas adhaerens MHS-3 TaxID=1280949 RepID=A0A069E6I6_9PROT|nr:hypothetical protein [Hyphomonas adhaerens]KCZ85667.1 hypothetical protein HAD_08280 [Hyphomonas adhaerens MHS-3]